MNRRDWLKISSLMAGSSLAPSAYAVQTGCQSLEFPSEWVRMGSNENPYGPSPKTIQAIQEAATRGNRYPDVWPLYDKIAKKHGVASENILVTAGSADVLGLIGVAYFGNAQGTMVAPRPTFFVLPDMVKRLGAKLIEVPLTADKKHDLKAMSTAITADTKVVYICNPNNPTGTKLDPSELKAFVEEISQKCIVAVDEVYLDFVNDPSLASLVATNKNVIVIRSFSKIYGLAGMRVGYAIAHRDTVSFLSKHIAAQGLAISQTAIAGASAAMDDTDFVTMYLQKNNESKQMLYRFLRDHNIEHIESFANCSYFSMDKLPKDFIARMNAKKIIVRHIDDYGKPYCRVSTGKPEEMQLFVDALKTMI